MTRFVSQAKPAAKVAQSRATKVAQPKAAKPKVADKTKAFFRVVDAVRHVQELSPAERDVVEFLEHRRALAFFE